MVEKTFTKKLRRPGQDFTQIPTLWEQQKEKQQRNEKNRGERTQPAHTNTHGKELQEGGGQWQVLKPDIQEFSNSPTSQTAKVERTSQIYPFPPLLVKAL